MEWSLSDMKASEPHGGRQESRYSSGLNLGLLCKLLRMGGPAWLPEPLTLGQTSGQGIALTWR